MSLMSPALVGGFFTNSTTWEALGWFGHLFFSPRVSLVAQRVKSLPAMWDTWVRSLSQEDPWRRKWQPTPVFLPGESQGWRSLVGYSPQGRRESDTAE